MESDRIERKTLESGQHLMTDRLWDRQACTVVVAAIYPCAKPSVRLHNTLFLQVATAGEQER